jgi:hypothetical protein
LKLPRPATVLLPEMSCGSFPGVGISESGEAKKFDLESILRISFG